MSNEPPVLSYDKPNTLSTRRSHWIIPGYSAGVMAAGVAYSLVAYFFLTRHYGDAFERFLYGILLPMSLPFATLLPQIIFLGITLWLKRKIVKEVRFGGFRAAFIWGAVEGLFPYSLFPVYQNSVGPVPAAMGFALLGWLVIFPTVAALFLCRHSHVRD